MLDAIEVLWPVFVAIAGFIVYKLIPYLLTRIFVHKNRNEELYFALVVYEMLGSLVAGILVVVVCIVFGASTLESIVLQEYWEVCFVLLLYYALGIFIILWYKKKDIKRKHLKNFFWGGAIYLVLSLQLVVASMLNDEENVVWWFVFFVLLLLFGQYVDNLDQVKTKNVTYIVFTENEQFESADAPIKKGDFYYVSVTNEAGKAIKQIQVPKDKIVKIECLIEKVEATEE